jgi:dienelactone hydrolase
MKRLISGHNKITVMLNVKNAFLFVFVLTTYIIACAFGFLVNSDYGNLDINRFTISGEPDIVALMYKPKCVSRSNAVPGIVLCHGISGSKEMLSQIALELAKNGFVAVTIDIVGHGDSGGSFGGFGFDTEDKTLGVSNVVQYLIEQDCVNSTAIGLVGHSLGAGAIRATALIFDNIAASVFIGGGLGDPVNNSDYGILNTTFPKNLLIVIGEQDVLFDLEKTKEEVSLAFGNISEIAAGEVYGDFYDFSARSLVVPVTTHLFEPSDPVTVTAVVEWMKKSLGTINVSEEVDLTYLNRELAVGVGLISILVLVFPLSLVIFTRYYRYNKTYKPGRLGDWGLLIVWSILGLGLFLPMFFIGSQIPFPPLLFGNSFSWWLFVIAIAGLVIAKFLLPRFAYTKFNLKSSIMETLKIRNFITASVIFAILYIMVFIAQGITFCEQKIIVLPLFKSITNPSRVFGFISLIPFYFTYFLVEGVYFYRYRIAKDNSLLDFLRVVTIKVAPYIILILVNYLPMFLFNFRLFPSFFGFIMEFVLGIIPLFIITISFSWWFFRKTKSIGVGIIFNTLLFAWSSAAIFPLSFGFL